MSASHLVRRFVGALRARPPSPADEAWVDAHLLEGERRLWIRLGDADRAHSLLVARRFVAEAPDAPRAAVAAALLHDIGKVDGDLGTFGRVVATLVGPRGERFRRYHEHEAIGLALLREAGSDPLTLALLDTGIEAPEPWRAALERADAI